MTHSATGGGGSLRLGDLDVLERVRAARNGSKFQDLFNGNWEGAHPSQSEADSALCSILSFWTQDEAQLDRLFRQSGLMRDKWDTRRGEQTYGEQTIRSALAGCREKYRESSQKNTEGSATRGDRIFEELIGPKANKNAGSVEDSEKTQSDRIFEENKSDRIFGEGRQEGRQEGRNRVLKTGSFIEVKPKQMEWLWKDRIAFSALTMLFGDPGLGKSFLTLSLAATITRGDRWPDGSTCPQGSALIISDEDSRERTIYQRLEAAGADLSLVDWLSVETQEGQSLLALERDLPQLKETLSTKPQTKLVIIDPISAYLDGTDSHNNVAMRRVLSPLSQIAESLNISIICVTHQNKADGQKAIYRMNGSIAQTALARSAYGVAWHPEDVKGRRVFLPSKNNIGNDKDGFSFELQQAPNGSAKVVWLEPMAMDLDEALGCGQHKEEREHAGKEQCAEWLVDTLSEAGSMPSAEVVKAAAQCGFKRTTLHDAKLMLGDRIKTRKAGFDKTKWYWDWVSSTEDSVTPPNTEDSVKTQNDRIFDRTRMDKGFEGGRSPEDSVPTGGRGKTSYPQAGGVEKEKKHRCEPANDVLGLLRCAQGIDSVEDSGEDFGEGFNFDEMGASVLQDAQGIDSVEDSEAMWESILETAEQEAAVDEEDLPEAAKLQRKTDDDFEDLA